MKPQSSSVLCEAKRSLLAMAESSESSSPSPSPSPSSATPSSVESNPWVSYAGTQAEVLRRGVAQSTEAVLKSTRSYVKVLQSSSSQYSQSAQNIFRTAQSEYNHYEDLFFGKVKEGLKVAGDHPTISYSIVAGAGLLVAKRPRRLLFRYTIGRFQSVESQIANSEKKVKELHQFVDLLKNESKKLEERAKFAEDELIRGRTKLKQAGNQLQNLVASIQKTENRAKGLLESLQELPGSDARVFRAEVAKLASEAKQRRKELIKKVSKISNFGIPV